MEILFLLKRRANLIFNHRKATLFIALKLKRLPLNKAAFQVMKISD